MGIRRGQAARHRIPLSRKDTSLVQSPSLEEGLATASHLFGILEMLFVSCDLAALVWLMLKVGCFTI